MKLLVWECASLIECMRPLVQSPVPKGQTATKKRVEPKPSRIGSSICPFTLGLVKKDRILKTF